MNMKKIVKKLRFDESYSGCGNLEVQKRPPSLKGVASHLVRTSNL